MLVTNKSLRLNPNLQHKVVSQGKLKQSLQGQHLDPCQLQSSDLLFGSAIDTTTINQISEGLEIGEIIVSPSLLNSSLLDSVMIQMEWNNTSAVES